MSLTTCLAGLPEDLTFYPYVLIVRYLFLLVLLDCVSGQAAARLAGKSKIFYLPRSGYRTWCRSVLQRAWLPVLPAFCAVFLLSLWLSPALAGDVVIAGATLILNIITLVGVQTLLILVFGSAASFVPLIFVQLLSVFFSCRLPGLWKLALPGNWGMILRSTFMTAEGYPLLAAACVEVLLLLLLWAEGWRLVRWYNRKDGIV